MFRRLHRDVDIDVLPFLQVGVEGAGAVADHLGKFDLHLDMDDLVRRALRHADGIGDIERDGMFFGV